MGYWVVHMKSNGTISESVLNFDKKVKEVIHGTEEWTFKTCKYGIISIIPRENILYVEWIKE